MSYDDQYYDDQYYGDDYYDDRYYYDNGGLRNRPLLLILISGCAGLLVGFACAACLGLGLAEILLSRQDASVVAESTEVALPDAPSYPEIRQKMEALTEAQWNQYTQTLIDTRAVNWTGWVEDVNQKASGGFELRVDMDSPDILLSVSDVDFDIPEDLALQLQKDQAVTFSGTVAVVANVLDSCQVTLKDVTVTPAPVQAGAPAPVATPVPQQPLAPAPADTPAPQQPAAPGEDLPVQLQFTGTGQQTVPNFQLESGPAIFEVIHDGNGTFIVNLIGPDGTLVQELVSTTGPFDGSAIVEIIQPGIHLLEIIADGNWSVLVEQQP